MCAGAGAAPPLADLVGRLGLSPLDNAPGAAYSVGLARRDAPRSAPYGHDILSELCSDLFVGLQALGLSYRTPR